MVRYRIDERPQGVAIRLTEVSGHRQELLDAFEDCQSGNCTCPTNEYQKLAGLEIAATDDEIKLHLKAKPGSQFDTDQISTCLDYTASKVQES